MHTNYHYIEAMLKERHQQFLAEAEMQRLISKAASTETKKKETISRFIFRSLETMRGIYQKKREPLACRCPGYQKG